MNTAIPEPIWIKELDKFTLREYPKQPNFLNCSIAYLDDEDSEGGIYFHFGSWGMDREEITQEMCLICCQAMLDCDANVSITSFKDNFEYAQNYFYEDEDDDMTDNSSFNEEEFDRYKAAVGELSNLKTIPIVITEQAAFFIIAQLQLAFRHPNNIGASRDVVRESIQPIVDYFTGDIREILERGFHPEFDVDTAPDPAWDYYEIWQSLNSIKAKIEVGIKFLAKQELADSTTNEKLVEILDPALEELGSLVESDLENFDYEDE